MLGQILDAFEVPKTFWAELVGCSPRQLDEWLAGQRQIPQSIVEKLSKAIGISTEILLAREKPQTDVSSLLPPLWLKARESGLGSDEHKAIAFSRLLAASYDEVLTLAGEKPGTWRTFFSEIKERIDPQDPARRQGDDTASAFLELTGLGKGATGIGEVLRGHLRARGVLVLETPINNRSLEGFCIPVGSGPSVRPCLVANSYRTTWFRRNYILLHELCHAIFDLEAANATFDLNGEPELFDSRDKDISEQRADSFALHALVPKRLITAYQSRGYKIEKLTLRELAELVAAAHAEQNLVIRAALEYGLVTPEEAAKLKNLDIAGDLRKISFHARGLAELSDNELIFPEVRLWGARKTSFPLRGLRLPIHYVRLVLELLKEGKISQSKAAELLMIRRKDLEAYLPADSFSEVA